MMMPASPPVLDCPPKEELAGTRAMLGALIKTQRALRQYGENAVSTQHEIALVSLATAHLARFGPCRLTVHERHLRLGEEVVLESTDPLDLGLLLFLNGIRKLSLLPGIDRAELHDLIVIANRAARRSEGHDDLVTLMWERSFESIAYVAVDQLASPGDGPRVSDTLASGFLGAGGGGAEAEAESVRVDDLPQRTERLPVAELRCDEWEIEDFQNRLDAEESVQYWRVLTDLATELTLLDEDADQRCELRRTFVAVMDRLIEEDQSAAVVHASARLDELQLTIFRDVHPVGLLHAELVRALGDPVRLGRILRGIDRTRGLEPSALEAFLGRLGTAALGTVLSWMAQAEDSELTRAASAAFLAAGPEGVASLASEIAHDEAQSATLTRELLHVLERHPEVAGLPIARALLCHADPEIRLEVAWALGPYRDGPVGEAWLTLLRDEDPRLFRLAVGSIVKSGRPELAEGLQELADTAELGEAERMHLYGAIGQLGRDLAIEWLVPQIEGRSQLWLMRARNRRRAAEVLHAIRSAGTPRARKVLEQLERTGARPIRKLCVEMRSRRRA